MADNCLSTILIVMTQQSSSAQANLQKFKPSNGALVRLEGPLYSLQVRWQPGAVHTVAMKARDLAEEHGGQPCRERGRAKPSELC